MKNAIIAVLSATTLFFGYEAYFNDDKSGETAEAFAPPFKSEAIKEYENAKFFEQTFIPFTGKDSMLIVKEMIEHYHTRLLPRLNNGINDNDSLVGMVYKFKSQDIIDFIQATGADSLYFHNAALSPTVAQRFAKRYGRSNRQFFHKPTVIIINKAPGLAGSSYILGGQVCPPPKGCL